MGCKYQHDRPAFEKTYREVSAPLPRRSPDQGLFYTYLTQRGLNARLASDNGWFPSRDAGDHAPRIVIPCSTGTGRVYWQARAMYPSALPRYQSPPVRRGDALVLTFPNQGTYNAIQGYTKQVMIVEGPLDALAVSGAGYTGVGLMGNNPPAIVLERIVRMFRDTAQEVFIFADSDALGEMSNVSIKLSSEGLKIKLIHANGYKDPASLPVDSRAEILRTLTNALR